MYIRVFLKKLTVFTVSFFSIFPAGCNLCRAVLTLAEQTVDASEAFFLAFFLEAQQEVDFPCNRSRETLVHFLNQFAVIALDGGGDDVIHDITELTETVNTDGIIIPQGLGYVGNRCIP